MIHVLYSRAALQTCVEVSEILRQFHEGKIGGDVLHPFVKPDISKLLLQTLLPVLTQMLL